MSWRDTLKTGSFKGVEFKTEAHDHEFGRRVDVNEYPFRDTPFSQDLGAKAKRYSISAYVIGENYHIQRDALKAAIEEGGAGILIHPSFGTLNVIPETIRLSESNKEGGMAIFSLNFVEAGTNKYPIAEPVPVDLVSLSADNLIAQIKSVFVAGIQLKDVSEFVRKAQAGSYTASADIFNDILKTGGINNQIDTDSINQAAVWIADVDDLLSSASQTISDVQGTADKFISIFKGIFDLSPSADNAISNLNKFDNFSGVIDQGAGSLSQITRQNAALTETFLKTVSIANESKALVSKDYETYDEAIDTRKSFLARLDVLAGETTSDNVYDSIRELRKEVSKAVPDDSQDLPRIRQISLPASIPSLVMSYDIYGSTKYADQIINRNKIRHPGFMPGGEPLDVLEYE